ncbi:hypothetical protein [Ramlibacter rhizophilus]|uniref:Uncharacterized protein n=1 Tax=Ramlibacter rhizophilus TaxID=1781167 RepID=A0A4Z0BGN9_9BURK|nr:hypothetical protein [Ramlibacter rhizophilus]TFY97304.1 hypothetical protein EZ242_17395 [Ramlibacter rhizophilus]
MCPDDTTPDPRTMTRSGDEPEFVQPRSDVHPDAPHKPAPPRPGAREMAQRPGLPEHPEHTAADVEDEEADPVGGDKPSLGDRFKSDSELQRG